jgi:hypothetical protein
VEGDSHRFVETYTGSVAFGFPLEIDEASLAVDWQNFSEDRFLEFLSILLSNDEMISYKVFSCVS